MKRKRSLCLLLSAVVGTLYVGYLLYYFYGVANGAVQNADAAESLGSSIAVALVTPHLLIGALGVIFNWIGWAGNKRGFALTSAILYSVAAVIFMAYAPFMIPEIVFGFVGFARLKKINEYNSGVAA